MDLPMLHIHQLTIDSYGSAARRKYRGTMSQHSSKQRSEGQRKVGRIRQMLVQRYRVSIREEKQIQGLCSTAMPIVNNVYLKNVKEWI